MKLDLTEHENLINQMKAEPKFENLELFEPSPTQREIVEEDEEERLILEQEDREFARELKLLEKEQKKGKIE